MKKIITLLMLMALVACKPSVKKENSKFTVVTTTTMITDLVKVLGGDAIEVKGIMGAGVDPHLYKASEGDVTKLSSADLIIYNGLHLEGKLVDVFEKMNQIGKETIALGDFLAHDQIINSELFASSHDPHIWFSINNWQTITEKLMLSLIKADPENTAIYQKNGKSYLEELETLKIEMNTIITTLPKEKRILVTAHDAFSYFGKEFGFEVVGLQGLSTATEAGVKDVQRISEFIITNKIKAIFVESSVPKRTVEALQASVQSKGHQVNIGGQLFSDALGDPLKETGKYIGMYRYNVNTIVHALK
ncbi:metal ABC transporter solute-binding protein, Zn/Mn family [Wenyingzhuangia sp. 2_MG-2023]|uniref:metal ABC transporter solute-binding protein, Zn/Mn family n=1 Tax=Wenyingzhuangia sp. 2_MG-2023 TaxID=3062639 RepID=UPI0026E1245B|nr:zinc ABC transporter substrate-binding protein [Wenyingzhuangia sp. 2_MG-2023]MDO6736482.1 zinc ABC transporter substrate-binding protein [Wenyingzhuangia sp. 2_MG-2023]